MAIDVITLGAARKYTDQTVIGLGGLKGANCTIKNITHQDGINRVTFEWTGLDGTKVQQTMEVYDGTPIYVWESGNTYNYGDLVIYESAFYRCITENSDVIFDDTKYNEIGSPDGNYDIVADSSLLPNRFTAADRKMYYSIDDEAFWLWNGQEWILQFDKEILNTLQPKTMSEPITVDGTSQTTVEGALSAINTLAAGNKTNKQDKNLSSAITVDGTSQTTVEGALGAINTLAAGNKTNIGTLSSLNTTAKSNTVAAINEVNSKCDSINDTIVDDTTYPSSAMVSVTDCKVPSNAAVSVEFEPIQEGTGDPSPENIRPISGRNDITITRTGKNLCSGIEQGARQMDGTKAASDIRVRSTNIMYLKPGTYSISATSKVSGTIKVLVSFRTNDVADGDNPQTSETGWENTPYTFTISDNSYISLLIAYATNTAISASNLTVQLEAGSTPTAYEPYSATDYTLSLNGTRYGGRVDISDTGECWLTASWKSITLNLSDASTADILGDYSRYLYSSASAHVSDVDVANRDTSLCDIAPYIADWYGQFTHFYIFDTTALVITLPTNAGISSFQVCYPIATPFQIPLTNTPIKLEKGTNNLYSDAGNISATVNGITSAIGALTEQVNDITNKFKGTVYTFYIDPDESDSYEAVLYNDDAIGMTPASMGATSFNYGSWAAFINKICKPCMLKFDGTVDYYLDPNDYSKKVDGTASDVADLSYPGNAMVEFSLLWWKSWGNGWISIADYQVDATYKCWSNLDADGNIIPYFYLPIYNGVVYDGKMRSISGIQLKSWSTTAYSSSATYAVGDEVNHDSRMWKCITAVETPEDFDATKWEQFAFNANTTGEEEIAYATANNTTAKVEWYTDVFCDRGFINALLILISKSIDTQGTFGRGLDSGSQSAKEAYITGSLNDKGLFWGSTTDGTHAVKVFGMENWLGLEWRRTAGLIGGANNTYLYKMTGPYNTTGAGYSSTGGAPSTNSWIKKMKFGEWGMLPSEVSSESTKYYKDQYRAGTNYAIVGGSSVNDSICGAFCVSLQHAMGNRGWNVGTSLSCKPCAIKEAIVNE